MKKIGSRLPKYDSSHVHAEGLGPLPLRSFFLFLSLVFALFISLYSRTTLIPEILYYRDKTLTINGNYVVEVEIANNDIKRQRGLSGRATLGEGKGMLFTFEDRKDTLYPVFWMKDMKFPIDIIWINEDKVVYLDRNVPPADPKMVDKDLTLYVPPMPVSAVLEVSAGSVLKNNITVGSKVKIQ